MQLDKNTWHYRVWNWTHVGPTPIATNLCSYVQRIIWLPILYGLVGLIFYTVVPLFFYLIATPIGLLFGYRPGVWAIDPLGLNTEWTREQTTHEPMVKYDLYRIGNFAMKTWYLLILGLVVFIEYALCYFHGTRSVLVTEGAVIGALVAIVGGFICLCWVSDASSGIGFVVKAWFKAKKQGVCPLVTFTDSKVQNENQ